MKINMICRKLIKPATPTPPNLKNYQISFWDCRQIPSNMVFVLFYESKSEPESEPDRHLKLEETLAETLVQFYPLSGRFIKELKSVDCSDQGVEFIQAEAPDVDLASIIGAHDQHLHLIPDQYFQVDESADQPLLSIQFTRFACGGTAAAVSVSHRVFDVSSFETFLAAWSSAVAAPEKTTTVTPLFDLPSLLPANNHTSVATVVPNASGEEIVVKILHFDRARLAKLKSKIGKPVSAARAAFVAVAKALVLLDGRSRGGRCRGFHLLQMVNMRERTTSPVAKHSCGNFAFLSLSRRVDAAEAAGISLPELSGLIGEAVRRCIADHAGVVSADAGRDGCDIIIRNRDEFVRDLGVPDTNVIFLTDLSRFGFYEVDLGWGKPAWTSCVPPRPRHNCLTTLMRDREGDGIEAWLRFDPTHTNCFQLQQDWEFINQVISDLSN